MAKRAMEKANQQLVTPYVTLKGDLDGIDFRDHDCRRTSDKQTNNRTGLDCGRMLEWQRMPRVGVSAEQQQGEGEAGWMSGSTL